MNDAITILERVKRTGGFEAAQRDVDASEKYNGSWWRSTFVGTTATPDGDLDSDVEWILNQHPSTLSRRDILTIGRREGPSRDRRLLLATLMWGYGTRGLRFPTRMRTILAGLLGDPRLANRLDRCAKCLAEQDLGNAYLSLTGIPGVRSAYFTKYLYFKGKALSEHNDYPLILDTKVSESLAWLTGYRCLVNLDGPQVSGYWPQSVIESR